MPDPVHLYCIAFLQHVWPPLIPIKELFSFQLLRFLNIVSSLNIVKSRLLWPSFQVRYSVNWYLDCATCTMMKYITRHTVFSSKCKCWNARVFDIIFWLNYVYSLVVSKLQNLLLKHLPVHILLNSLTLSRCKNEPMSLGKMFLAFGRAFLFFHLAGALFGIMLGLTQSNKDLKVILYRSKLEFQNFLTSFVHIQSVVAASCVLFLGKILNHRSLSPESF